MKLRHKLVDWLMRKELDVSDASIGKSSYGTASRIMNRLGDAIYTRNEVKLNALCEHVYKQQIRSLGYECECLRGELAILYLDVQQAMSEDLREKWKNRTRYNIHSKETFTVISS